MVVSSQAGFVKLNHPKDSSPMMDAIFQEQNHTNYIDPFASFHAENSHSRADMSHANMSNSHNDSDVLMGSTNGMYQVDPEDQMGIGPVMQDEAHLSIDQAEHKKRQRVGAGFDLVRWLTVCGEKLHL
ncbi:hypothetical protein GH714_041996 [Hevea brasiliensis]|uniref:Uncharacterized protein n=1 Tax=Hevea brasiliensis TaxID=3981 RepID=A0A6A6MVP9_HEVBR|nr:hypothetical protein GH714_041996 [Hevea brasiliensis]